MPRFGAHQSIAGGPVKAVELAVEAGCECLQLFVKSPSQWRAAPLTDGDVAAFRDAAAEAGLAPLVGHVSYLVNVASPDEALWTRSRDTLLEEWDRAERLGLAGLVLHPGSHKGAGVEAGLARVVAALDWLHPERPDHGCRILVEGTAGAGAMLGGRLEEVQHLVEVPAEAERLGVCLDTCHLFAAGYDLRTPEAVEATLAEVEATVALGRVAVLHANDATGRRGSHLDRHAAIGKGRIGTKGFRALVNHPALARMPFILETPKEDEEGRAMDPVNLRALRRLVRDKPAKPRGRGKRT